MYYQVTCKNCLMNKIMYLLYCIAYYLVSFRENQKQVNHYLWEKDS